MNSSSFKDSNIFSLLDWNMLCIFYSIVIIRDSVGIFDQNFWLFLSSSDRNSFSSTKILVVMFGSDKNHLMKYYEIRWFFQISKYKHSNIYWTYLRGMLLNVPSRSKTSFLSENDPVYLFFHASFHELTVKLRLWVHFCQQLFEIYLHEN